MQLTGEYDNPVNQKKIKAQIQVLEDANAKMTIAPLIAAGEFSQISEGLTEADQAVRDGTWVQYIEKQVDKLPGPAATVAKNVLITKDTALFQGMNRMVQHGDFVAKAVLYDHLTKKKGMDSQAALDVILEEFVQYNRLPGRGRDALESNGLLWFYNYKLRIMKIAGKLLRDRPVSTLFLMGGFGPTMDVSSVGSSSVAGGIFSGNIGYSVGPEMGIKSPDFQGPLTGSESAFLGLSWYLGCLMPPRVTEIELAFRIVNRHKSRTSLLGTPPVLHDLPKRGR